MEINLFVPYERRHEIDSLAAESFEIIHTSKDRSRERRFYIIKTTEEEYVALSLKYGRENVWKR